MAIPITRRRLRHRRTRIVATLGPASRLPGRLEALVARGVDAFRLNMSHGTHDDHAAIFRAARAAAANAGRTVGVFADLSGPKIRTGRFAGGEALLADGAAVVVTTRDVVGDARTIPCSYGALGQDLLAGARLLLDDGRLELRVERVDGDDVHCRVLQGGVLSDHKGINLPNTELSTPALTDKDRSDAAFAVELGVDAVALSFVRRPEDVLDLRRFLDGLPAGTRRRVPILVKIEKPEALERIDAILDVAEGVMVARGDLGVEIPAESVPAVQDSLVEAARRRALPVLVATQMLDSMIRNPRPTRAEIQDVAHAVSTGADGVMLSGETAVGEFPVEAVEVMDRVIRETEARLYHADRFASLTAHDAAPGPLEIDRAMARTVAQLSRDLDVRAILAISRTGHSISMISAARPAATILAVSSNPSQARARSADWGVIAVEVEPARLADEVRLIRELAAQFDLAEPGTVGLVVRGFRPEPSENHPAVRVVPFL